MTAGSASISLRALAAAPVRLAPALLAAMAAAGAGTANGQEKYSKILVAPGEQQLVATSKEDGQSLHGRRVCAVAYDPASCAPQKVRWKRIIDGRTVDLGYQSGKMCISAMVRRSFEVYAWADRPTVLIADYDADLETRFETSPVRPQCEADAHRRP